MTVNEFIVECETYPFSKEAYEIQQELYETKLLAMALDSMEFQESAEEYLEESGIEDTLIEFTEKRKNDAYNKFTGKKNSVWGKIKGGLQSLLSKVINFFAAIADKFSGQEMKANRIRRFLATAPKSPALAQALLSSIGKGQQKADEKLDKGSKGINTSTLIAAISAVHQDQINFGNFTTVIDEGARNILSGILNPKKVKIKPVIMFGSASKIYPGRINMHSRIADVVTSPETIAKYVNRFKVGRSEWDNLTRQMREDASRSQSTAVEITVSGKALERAMKSLKKTKDLLSQAGKAGEKRIEKEQKAAQKSRVSGSEEAYSRKVEQMEDGNAAFMLLKSMCSSTMRVYSALNTLRTKVIDKAYKYVSGKGAKEAKSISKEEKSLDTKTGYESAFDDLIDGEEFTEAYEEFDYSTEEEYEGLMM